jgi:iron complex outermembrane recepter protein
MIGEDWNSFNKGLLYEWPRSYKGIDKENYANPDGSQNPQEGIPFQYVSRTLWWDYYNNNTTLNRDKYTAALTLVYDIAPWLNALGRVSRDFTIEQFETRHKPIDAIGLEKGFYSNGLSRNIGDNYDFTITAFKDGFLNSKFDVRLRQALPAGTRIITSSTGVRAYGIIPICTPFFNFTETTYITDANNNTIVDRPGNSAESMVPEEGVLRKRINSVYSFLNLAYDNYLYLELTGRNDWSSTLPPANNSYFYPSVSLSFIMTEAFNITDRTLVQFYENPGWDRTISH